MKNALMLASVASMIDKFNMDNIGILKNMGYFVDVATNFEYGSAISAERAKQFKQELAESEIGINNVSIPRSITNVKAILTAYRSVRKLCRDNNYQIVHCHSPIGGVVARLACRKLRKKGARVIYTAHGFHFYKGAPLLNWLLFFPIEWVCSFFTDTLITINKEDYAFAKKYLHAKSVQYVPGVGIDIDAYSEKQGNRDDKRAELGVSAEDIMLMSVGELNTNKNHELVIRAISTIQNSNIHYFIAGKGDKEEYLKNLVHNLNIEDKVHFLGYRSDISQLLSACDIFCFPSFREGLSVALMEAMAKGAPCIVSNIRGNEDLIKDGEGGYLVSPFKACEFKEKIEKLCVDGEQRVKMGKYNSEHIKNFSLKVVHNYMEQIYQEEVNHD